MLKYDDKAILYNPKSWKTASWFKKLRARFWDSWVYRLYQYSWLYHLRWFLKHWWCHDNWVKTNLSINFHDKRNLMKDALFSLVENYVARDQEDAFARVVVENEEREMIIDILHFYRIREPELQKRYDMLLHEAFGYCEDEFIPCEDRPTFYKWKQNYIGDLTNEQREDIIKYMRRLEEFIYNETQRMLKMCVDVRAYLWT